MKLTMNIEVEPQLTDEVYAGVIELVDRTDWRGDPEGREALIMKMLVRASQELRPWVDDDGMMTVTFDTMTGVPRIVSVEGRR